MSEFKTAEGFAITVGSEYVMRDGTHTTIVSIEDDGGSWPIEGNGGPWDSNGRFLGASSEHDNDLMRPFEDQEIEVPALSEGAADIIEKIMAETQIAHDHDKELANILRNASHEITSLRRQNEILQAKVDVIDTFSVALFTNPNRERGAAIDVVWEISRKLQEMEDVE